jgi:hypothetical protein
MPGAARRGTRILKPCYRFAGGRWALSPWGLDMMFVPRPNQSGDLAAVRFAVAVAAWQGPGFAVIVIEGDPPIRERPRWLTPGW